MSQTDDGFGGSERIEAMRKKVKLVSKFNWHHQVKILSTPITDLFIYFIQTMNKKDNMKTNANIHAVNTFVHTTEEIIEM